MTAPTRTYARGAVVMANLGPITGSEQDGLRPVVIISSMVAIKKSNSRLLFVIVPLTCSQSLIGPLAPSIKARAGGVSLDSTALVMHIRSIDPQRVIRQVGVLEFDELAPILEGVNIMLELGR